MKLILENWRGYLKEGEELWGNCGMVAIAIAEEAQRRGLGANLVLVHDADDDGTLAYGDYKLFHVAAAIDGKYYDDRGEVTHDELIFDDFGDEVFIDEFRLDDTLKDAVKRNTNWSACPADFEERAKEILDEAGYTNEIST